jgi:FkbM family methyltransferase
VLPRVALEMSARRLVGRILGPASRQLRLPTFPARRTALLHELGVTDLVDVGANIGQYAAQVRLYGYRGALHSFEPLASAFAVLSARAAADSSWQARRLGLGRSAGTATLHVAGNSQSSSLLTMLPRHVETAPTSAIVGDEQIELTTLDHVLGELGPRCFVKIDAQGSERAILEGAGPALDRVLGLELELSLVPLYAGETLFADMVAWLATRGFELRALGNGMTDPRSGALLQVDAVLARAR